MTSGGIDWAESSVLPDPSLARKGLQAATSALLGDTIRLDDEQWHQPTRLPGWTRAHVASHIARNADALRHIVEEFLAGRRTFLYPDDRIRAEDVQNGSLRGGLDLQIDLDTSAGLLDDALDALDQSGRTGRIWLSGRISLPVQACCIARLAEVTVHHVDLDCGFGPDQIDSGNTRWLAAFELTCAHGDPRLPTVDVRTDSGLAGRIGNPALEPVGTVEGSDLAILGWVVGRSPLPPECLHGDAPESLPLR